MPGETVTPAPNGTRFPATTGVSFGPKAMVPAATGSGCPLAPFTPKCDVGGHAHRLDSLGEQHPDIRHRRLRELRAGVVEPQDLRVGTPCLRLSERAVLRHPDAVTEAAAGQDEDGRTERRGRSVKRGRSERGHQHEKRDGESSHG